MQATLVQTRTCISHVITKCQLRYVPSASKFWTPKLQVYLSFQHLAPGGVIEAIASHSGNGKMVECYRKCYLGEHMPFPAP